MTVEPDRGYARVVWTALSRTEPILSIKAFQCEISTLSTTLPVGRRRDRSAGKRVYLELGGRQS